MWKDIAFFQNANVCARTSGWIDSLLPGIGTPNVRTFNHLTISAGVTCRFSLSVYSRSNEYSWPTSKRWTLDIKLSSTLLYAFVMNCVFYSWHHSLSWLAIRIVFWCVTRTDSTDCTEWYESINVFLDTILCASEWYLILFWNWYYPTQIYSTDYFGFKLFAWTVVCACIPFCDISYR